MLSKTLLDMKSESEDILLFNWRLEISLYSYSKSNYLLRVTHEDSLSTKENYVHIYSTIYTAFEKDEKRERNIM